MCLILLALQAHPDYPLVVAANRDEHHARPAAPAAFWADHPAIYGGRDLEMGGTWMGLTRQGRFAAITNFREGRPGAAAPRSRGDLVKDYLAGQAAPGDYVAGILPQAQQYGGFSLLAGDAHTLLCCSNRVAAASVVPPGIHGLSNHLLDTPWPKVTRGTAAVAAALALPQEQDKVAALFALLADRVPAADAKLPDTGIPRQRERELSSAFITGASYGTRTSTVLLLRRTGGVLFHEKRFGPGGVADGETVGRFVLDAAAATA